jgi:hypothetical protein
VPAKRAELVEAIAEAIQTNERVFAYTLSVQMRAVSSTNIAEVGYDPVAGTLALRFQSGWRVYRYYRVPAAVYEAFLNAPSKGGSSVTTSSTTTRTHGSPSPTTVASPVIERVTRRAVADADGQGSRPFVTRVVRALSSLRTAAAQKVDYLDAADSVPPPSQR